MQKNSSRLIGMHIRFNENKYVYVERYLGRGGSCAAYICKVFNRDYQQIGWATLKEFLPRSAGFTNNEKDDVNSSAPIFEINEDIVCFNNGAFPSFNSRVLPSCEDEFKSAYIKYYKRILLKRNFIIEEISRNTLNSALTHNIVLPMEIVFSPVPTVSKDTGEHECTFVDNSYVALCLTEYSKDSVIEELDSLSIKEKLDIVSLLCRTIYEFHILNIVFLDLKPENFLYISKPQKLIEIFDFDSIQKTDNNGYILKNSNLDDIGTPFYSAPEVRMGNKENIGCWSDVFSICAILLSFIFGNTIQLTNSTHTDLKGVFSEENFAKVNNSLKDGEEKIAVGFWRKLQAITAEGMSRISSSRRYRRKGKPPVLALLDDINTLLDIYTHKGIHPEVMLDSANKLAERFKEDSLKDFNPDLLCETVEVN